MFDKKNAISVIGWYLVPLKQVIQSLRNDLALKARKSKGRSLNSLNGFH
jgi:hypothetical protein